MKIVLISLLITIAAHPQQQIVAQDTLPNIISSIKVSPHRIDIIAHEKFHTTYLNHNYYAEYQKDIDLQKLDSSILVTGFISIIIPALWISGQTYCIDALDQDFFESLKILKEVYKQMYPETRWDGELIPKKIVKNNPLNPDLKEQHKNDIALAFSGGLDSITSSIRNRDKHQLLLIGRGPVEIHSTGSQWGIFYQRVKKFADNFGHEIAWATSNRAALIKHFLNPIHLSHELVHYWQDLADSLSRIGLFAPIVLSKGYPVLYIGSTFTWWWPYATACAPFVDDNICISGMRGHHDSFDINRIEKQELLKNYFSEHPQEKPYCLSCANPWKNLKNCNTCDKCLRTIIGFVLIGENPRDYGFTLSEEDMYEKGKNCINNLASTLKPFSLPYFWVSMQNYIKEKAHTVEKLTMFEEWFLGFNMDTLMEKEGRVSKGRCDAISLLHFLPESFYYYASHEKTPQKLG